MLQECYLSCGMLDTYSRLLSTRTQSWRTRDLSWCLTGSKKDRSPFFTTLETSSTVRFLSSWTRQWSCTPLKSVYPMFRLLRFFKGKSNRGSPYFSRASLHLWRFSSCRDVNFSKDGKQSLLRFSHSEMSSSTSLWLDSFSRLSSERVVLLRLIFDNWTLLLSQSAWSLLSSRPPLLASVLMILSLMMLGRYASSRRETTFPLVSTTHTVLRSFRVYSIINSCRVGGLGSPAPTSRAIADVRRCHWPSLTCPHRWAMIYGLIHCKKRNKQSNSEIN